MKMTDGETQFPPVVKSDTAQRQDMDYIGNGLRGHRVVLTYSAYGRRLVRSKAKHFHMQQYIGFYIQFICTKRTFSHVK